VPTKTARRWVLLHVNQLVNSALLGIQCNCSARCPVSLVPVFVSTVDPVNGIGLKSFAASESLRSIDRSGCNRWQSLVAASPCADCPSPYEVVHLERKSQRSTFVPISASAWLVKGRTAFVVGSVYGLWHM
jgi:hypothetical protein